MAETIVNGTPEFVRFSSLLDSSSGQYREIDRILDLPKENPCLRDKIRRNLWPRQHARKYGIHTLFGIRLGRGYRMTYTVSGTPNSKIVTVLEVMDHKEYENLFRY